MARVSTNKDLHKAKDAKKDEFYTQLSDIERELRFYKGHFKNKVVYCNCDDPYENYDAINVNKTQDIPMDYGGVMGVPITFLHKFNPAQFEIIKFRKGNDDKDLSIGGKCPYFRILVKNKKVINK